MEPDTAPEVDLLLLGLAESADREASLSCLIAEHAEPVIRRVVVNKMGAFLNQNASRDLDDVASDAMARVIGQVRLFVEDPTGNAIANFRGYCASTAYHCCCEFLRQQHPRRWSLKNKVRYVLRHSREFALWQSAEGDWIAGLAEWCGAPGLPPPLQGLSVRADDVAAAVGTALRSANHPIELDALTGWLGAAMRLQDRVVQSITEFEVADSRPSAASELEQRESLSRLWREILELPARQRSALLLNLRDSGGDGVIDLLVATGIATFSQLATAVSLAIGELAGVWNDMPLEDARIAGMLGVTRQQVINLRKSARARLARRRIL